MYICLKRIFDLTVASVALLLLWPVMLMLAITIRIVLGRPILFRQARPGLDARPFALLKFRTMTNARDAGGCLLPDGCRLTSFGKFLRSTSFDELPQLWNVVRGDMSLVGPRPLLPEYLPLYSAEQLRRHEVRPGITGWAQIKGRNALSWNDKFELDVWYVDHLSLWLDLRILMLTLLKVFLRHDVHQAGYATVAPFTGKSRPDGETEPEEADLAGAG